MLKYEHITPGTRIRAYDFEPGDPRRTDRFIEGEVAYRKVHMGVAVLAVDCDNDSAAQYTTGRRGQEVLVPMESTFEWANRVLVIPTIEDVRAIDARLDPQSV